MTTTIRELIQTLEMFAEEHGDDCEVRLAQQPSWPFEYSLGEVVALDASSEAEERDQLLAELNSPHATPVDRADIQERIDEIDEAAEVPPVIYIGEGPQLAYLPGAAKDALGWGR